jgi:hypothetical protein
VRNKLKKGILIILGLAVVSVLAGIVVGIQGNVRRHASDVGANYFEPMPIVKLYDFETERFVCSGTVISDNRLLTAGHCIGDKDSKFIIKNAVDKRLGIVATVEVYAAAFQIDAAILNGNFTQIKHAIMLDNTDAVLSQLMLGQEPLMVCGYPWGGEIFCMPFRTTGIDYFQIVGSAIGYPGMSGGPIFNMLTGEILGVLDRVMPYPGGIAITPTVEILKALNARKGEVNEKDEKSE